jgi:hypothetical protein
MNIIVFNVCLPIAWLMILGGASLALGLGYGLIVGGVALVALTLLAAFVAGGLYGGKV